MSNEDLCNSTGRAAEKIDGSLRGVPHAIGHPCAAHPLIYCGAFECLLSPEPLGVIMNNGTNPIH